MKLSLTLVLFWMLTFCTSCTTKQSTPESHVEVVVVNPPLPAKEEKAVEATRIALYWEDTTEAHPERMPWSDKLTSIVRNDLALYSIAKDITEVCPNFHALTEGQKVEALGEFWVAIALHESGFNPKSSSVDVGSAKDRNSYSDGLYQMSGNDGASKKYGYNYKDLLDPIKNIEVATEQMRRQITKTGEIFLPKSHPNRYWAVILEGGRYQQIAKIKAQTLKYAPFCKSVAWFLPVPTLPIQPPLKI